MLSHDNLGKLYTFVSGVFLLLLAISGNFIAETLGCQTQKILQSNMLVKHIMTILICYFAINFASNVKNAVISPHTLMVYTLVIYTHFIIFTKCTFVFKCIVFALLFLTYMSMNYIKYFENLDSEKDSEKDSVYSDWINILDKTNAVFYVLIIINMLIGHYQYYKKQRKDHQKNWSYWIFLFGKLQCASHKK